ncbi:MAG: peptide-methionine (S)-S-oxide reductase MsrA [Candidatus Eremiobacteraeota bacterium]|nr:peptide-methionine (S)-S-oxide reductase MsrA [Candidatus Eremiobacteraeota bacterium]MBC5828153.1 peptide-methionine (S)-S-oxide reductase MsrA [Candidatus Eremiobacteraeota bacterium]
MKTNGSAVVLVVGLAAAALCLSGYSIGASAAARGSAAAAATAAPLSKDERKVVLAGGCFWGMEAVFDDLKGVSNVVSGYSGGSKATAHYEMVSTGLTGHAESVQISYDPSKISFDQLLKVYFTVAHDPTELNRQGPDDGSQYRSEIFYTTEDQKKAVQEYIARLAHAKAFHDPIVTKVAPLDAFYPAERYHQHFVALNPNYPYVVFNDRPKLEQLRQKFPDLVKSAR